MKKKYSQTEYVIKYVKAILKWIIASVLIGAACGLVGALFYSGVTRVTEIRAVYPWLLFLLPAAGLIITVMYMKFDIAGKGTDTVISAVRDGNTLKLSLIPAIFIGTVLTHLCGGSAGREGAALQIGGGLGNGVGSFVKMKPEDLGIATMAGMAAFFSAVFGTPLTATIFVVMFINVGSLYEMAVFPCFMSSMTAYYIAKELGAKALQLRLALPAAHPVLMIRLFLLAALCGVISTVMCLCFRTGKRFFHGVFQNPYIRVAAGGCSVVALTLLVKTGDYNGTGTEIIRRAVEEGVVIPYAFVLKIIFTTLTLESGYKGGEIVPTFFIGSTFGCLVAPLLGLPAHFGAAIGMVAVFGGATNTLIAPIFLGIEVFGGGGVLFFALASIAGYICSGYNGLYSSQKIIYSKVRAAARIDINTNKNVMVKGRDPRAYSRLIRSKARRARKKRK